MYTQCPKCQTLFRVGAQQLGAAQGRVRCSKCLTVFNALQRLYEQLPAQLREEFLRTPERRGRAAFTGVDAGPRDEPPLSATGSTATEEPAQAPVTASTRPRRPRRVAVLPAPADPASDAAAGAVVKPPSAWGTAVWSVGIALMLVSLVGQWAWLMREDLAAYPGLRPWLERMCALEGCRLPLRRDPGAVVLKERDVRSHPSVDSALLINATIVNDAGFPQSYPGLELALSDTAGNVIASRVFRPEEYLGRPLAPGEAMPVGVPVHLRLELADPGKNAVGFAFEFR